MQRTCTIVNGDKIKSSVYLSQFSVLVRVSNTEGGYNGQCSSGKWQLFKKLNIYKHQSHADLLCGTAPVMLLWHDIREIYFKTWYKKKTICIFEGEE